MKRPLLPVTPLEEALVIARYVILILVLLLIAYVLAGGKL